MDCLPELQRLAVEKNTKERKLYLKEAKDCVIDAISEIALNCLKGNIPLKNCDFKKLKKYQSIVRELSKISPNNRRRNILIQKGGALFPLLIPPALSLIASIVGKFLSNKINK